MSTNFNHIASALGCVSLLLCVLRSAVRCKNLVLEFNDKTVKLRTN